MNDRAYKVYIKTLGCKVNTVDSRVLENQFQMQGHELSDTPDNADIVVINTCSVTANAEKEARYLLRRYQRENEDSLRIVTVCYAQIHSSSLEKMPEVDFIVPNQDKSELVSIVLDKAQGRKNGSDSESSKLPSGRKAVSENKQNQFKSSSMLFEGIRSEAQTRAFVKIQDGCNGFCSYCQIPYARGESRSAGEASVITEVKNLLSKGVKEIVFTGIHVGDYGSEKSIVESEKLPIASLLEKILVFPDLKRFRISSLEPSEVRPQLLEVLGQFREKVCDHFHLPLQSGNDRILKLMNRQYDTAGYADAIKRIRDIFPSAMITADVIPGFPQETDREFEDTCEFVKNVGLNGLHVFPYSMRPNTSAVRLPGHVDSSVVKERSALLRGIGKSLEQEYYRKFTQQHHEVLWESRKNLREDNMGKNYLVGKTKNYLNVIAHHEGFLPGEISMTYLTGLDSQGRLVGVASRS